MQQRVYASLGFSVVQSLVSLFSFVTLDDLDWSALSCFAFNKASYAQAVINTNVVGKAVGHEKHDGFDLQRLISKSTEREL
jgi:hypothetical protein